MRLLDLTEFIVDCPHSTSVDEGEGIPLIRTPNIGAGFFILDNVHRVSEEVYEERIKRGKPQKNDLIYAREAPAGNVAIIKDEKLCLGQRTVLIRPDIKKVDPYYLMYYLLSEPKKNKLLSKAHGSTVSHVNMKEIRDLDVDDIMPLEIQHKISSILSAYDYQIENNQKRIKLLEQMAENLYKEWFVRFRFPGYENAEFEGGIPKGWKYEPIRKLGQIIGGGTPSTSIPEYWDGDIPWLSPVDLSNNQRVYVKQGKSSITDLGMKKSSTKLLPADTVLLSSRAPVGYVALAANPICTNQGFKSVICNEDSILPYYLYFFFKQNTEVLKSFASGATFPELSGSTLGRIKILVPPINIQENFTSLLKPVISQMEYLFDQNDLLTTQRDLLLPRLMSGKLSI